uniref:Zinc finger protein 648 n=2 Tax=Culex pipiens TaxID=7175 RepID=A0A8D8FBD3_CULPI
MTASCCRLCLRNGSDLLPVRKLTVNPNGTDRPPVTPTLTQLIISYLSLEPVIDSTKQTNICSDCRNMIAKWHWFRESCLQNDAVFRRMAQDPGKDDAAGQIDLYYEVEVKKEEELDICEEDFGENLLTGQLEPSPESVLAKEKEGESTAKRKVRRPRMPKSERRMQPCPRCGKVVKNMARHLRMHNIVRRCFQCPHCAISFYTKGNLKKHINIHTLEVKHTCHVCDRIFARDDTLKRHVKLMHLEKPPFKCPDCSEVFRYRVGLARHQKSHKKAYRESGVSEREKVPTEKCNDPISPMVE